MSKIIITTIAPGLIVMMTVTPVAEAIHLPPENCRLSAPCPIGILDPQDGPEPISGADPPVSYNVGDRVNREHHQHLQLTSEPNRIRVTGS